MYVSLVPDINVARYHTTNRTASSNGQISQARAAGLRKYGYEDGIAVMERISGTLLIERKLLETAHILKKLQLLPIYGIME